LDLSLRLEVVTSSVCLQLLVKEFHTAGPLTQNAFADKANDNEGTVSKLLLEDRSVRAGLYLSSSDARYAGVPVDLVLFVNSASL